MKFGKYDTFSFVDVETTGTSASQDRVLEIGIIKVKNGEVVDEINTLIDAGVYIPPEITMITGIREEDVINAPTFPDIADKVQELLEDSVFVAHNARFDHAFIKHEFRRLGLPFNPKTLDTVKLARKLYPFLPRHNLDTIISFLGISVENRHRAYDDASVLFTLMKRVSEEFPQSKNDEIITQFLKSPSLPRQIEKENINTLPEGPGVYMIYGSNDSLLYIGKSVDIKARVLSHFYNDFESNTDIKLSQEATRVEAHQTAGDIGASILEANLIKSMFPLYNKALRKGAGLIVAVQTEVDGYLTIKQVNQKDIKPEDIENILFVASSKRQFNEIIMEKAKENKLCLKLLGIEKGSGRCFGSQIDLCLGACTKEEPAFKYNVRFIEAFYDKRVKPWPFKGAIGIKEKFEEIEEIHVINNWCYMGSIKNESESIDEMKDLIFSWDNYKIIQRFIKKPAIQKSLINF